MPALSQEFNDTLMEVEHTPPIHKKVLDIVPGVAGGVARVMVGQPFDTIKTRLQVLGQGTALAATLPPEMTYKNSMDCVRKMVKNEGPFSLYKGTVAPLIGNMILLGIHFPVFSKVRAALEDGEAPGTFSHWKILAAGGAAGAAGSLVSTPVELVRTKLQMQRRAALASTASGSGSAAANAAVEDVYKGSLDAFRKIVSRYGLFRGLYSGYTVTLLRDVQGYAWFFYGYEATIHALAGPGKTKADLSYMQVIAAGIMAGFGLWGSMFPIDTIKSKIQADNLANPQYKNLRDCYSRTYQAEGFNGMMRGFSAAMWRAIPVNASIFLAVEGARQAVDIIDKKITESQKAQVPAQTATL